MGLFKEITYRHLKSIPKGSNVFLSFGEIDCRPDEGFISASRKLNEPINALIQKTTESFIRWFQVKNRVQQHSLYLFNIPAPTRKESLSESLNKAVADVIVAFNRNLENNAKLCDIKLIDVHKLTAGSDGFSNLLYHVDNWHLGPSIIPQIEKQLI